MDNLENMSDLEKLQLENEQLKEMLIAQDSSQMNQEMRRLTKLQISLMSQLLEEMKRNGDRVADNMKKIHDKIR